MEALGFSTNPQGRSRPSDLTDCQDDPFIRGIFRGGDRRSGGRLRHRNGGPGEMGRGFEGIIPARPIVVNRTYADCSPETWAVGGALDHWRRQAR